MRYLVSMSLSGAVGQGESRRRARGLSIALVLAGVAVGLVGCAERACTLAGCFDSVGYDIPDGAFAAWDAAGETPVVATVCVDDECQSTAVHLTSSGEPRQSAELSREAGTLDLTDVYMVSLTVTGSSGETLLARVDTDVTLDRFEPNGPHCQPTCGVAVLSVEPAEVGL